MSFRNQGSHVGCNCRSASQNTFGRRASPYGNPKGATVQEDSMHSYMQMEDILMQERTKFKEIK